MRQRRTPMSKKRREELLARETRFGAFLRDSRKRMTALDLAAESNVSRQHIHRLRYGQMEPTREVMVRLRYACSRILGRTVRMSELFDLGDE